MPNAADILSPQGPIATKLHGEFEPRPEQLQMAAAVEEAMRHKSHLFVEAGTGVGKSFAYLVPAILRAIQLGETVVICTHTISLQEQLIQKDIPLLASLLDPQWNKPDPNDPSADHHLHDHYVHDHQPHDSFEESTPVEFTSSAEPQDPNVPELHRLRPVLVKGRGNYVSIRRLRLASERQDKLFADPAARRSLHVIEDWAMNTEDGTLSSLPPLERGGVWDKVQSDSGNCMGRRCSQYERCFYQSARRKMEAGNLLICNHALFFSDLALRTQDTGFLPRYQHVIIDEAHTIEDVASEHFGVNLSEGRVQHLLSTLYQIRTGKGFLPQLSLIVTDEQAISKACHLVEQASAACRSFFESLMEIARRSPPPGDFDSPWTTKGRTSGGIGLGTGTGGAGGAGRKGGGERREQSNSYRIREPGAIANILTPALRELGLRLKALKDLAKIEADKFELNSYCQRAEMIATDAEALVSQSMPGCAYWVEWSTPDDAASQVGFRSATPRITYACSPVDVAPLLKERLFNQEHSVVLTSATLATRTVRTDETTESSETAFSHVLARLGAEGAKTLQLGSPFDYAKQVEVIIDAPAANSKTLPRRSGSFTPRKSGGYNTDLARKILQHVRETDGGAFVLFTSFASLNAVASELAGPLSQLGLPLLAQGRDGSRTHILQRFRENERSVLLGAASFWQGVDVRGRGLRNVIITKLPFDPPDRPLTQARLELIEQRGGNPFMEDSLPRAVIRFKQGFGRLIRSRTDSGRVVILDDRVLTARYGRLFLQALPEGVPIRRADAPPPDCPEPFDPPEDFSHFG